MATAGLVLVAAGPAVGARDRWDGTIKGQPESDVRMIVRTGDDRPWVKFAIGRIELSCDHFTAAFSFGEQKAWVRPNGKFTIVEEFFDPRDPDGIVEFWWIRGQLVSKRKAEGRVSAFVDQGFEGVPACTGRATWVAKKTRPAQSGLR